MRSRIVRVAASVSLCVFVVGVLAEPSFARDFPAKRSGGVSAGIPERGVYLMTTGGQRVAAPGTSRPFYGYSSLTGRSLVGSQSANASPFASPRQTPNPFGSRAQVDRLIPGASTVLPSGAQKDQRLLAVHMGTETVYVSFKTEAERKQFIADLKRNLADVGLAVERRARTGSSSSEGRLAQGLANVEPPAAGSSVAPARP